jgi:hypothetical protein
MAPERVKEHEDAARALVDEMAERVGDGPADAFTRGKLFSEWGSELLEWFSEYRRRVGAGAEAAPFRAALRARWNIELPEADQRAIG